MFWRSTCLTSSAFMAVSFFMHDSAPCHKAKKVTRFLDQQEINVLELPGNSPDLNSIKNCWQKMKKTTSEKKTLNLDTFKEELNKM